jgi:rhamnopyranosyl-N-acetylglucosaminyl-diphospho-decaprenol beta-1,3/1,4-galactofuranosyltransferase
MSGVCAIVVTHDRREMLVECLAALAGQSRPPDRVLVVDNASRDGTREMLEREHPGVDVLALPTNQGGAGGFHEGMRLAHGDGAEWLWLMDDDTIPRPDALEQLLAARGRLDGDAPPALLASAVLWRDGRLHPMNAPWPDGDRVDRTIDGAARGLLPVRFATFASLLVHRGAVDRHGLPLKHFFLWSDDVEYTSRMVLSGELAYLVPDSVAMHLTPNRYTNMSAAPDRFYYHVRNTLYMARDARRPPRDRLVRLLILLASSAEYLLRHPSAASAAAIGRGLRDGLRPPPTPPRPGGTRTTASRAG